jgi:hypothetical protein
MSRFRIRKRPTGFLLIAAIGVGSPFSDQRPPVISSPADQISFSSKQESSRKVKWIYTTANTIFAGPVIGNDGTIYVSSSDNDLY